MLKFCDTIPIRKLLRRSAVLWDVVVKSKARKYLDKVNPVGRKKDLENLIDNLKVNGIHGDVEAMGEDQFRIRIGGYRVIIDREEYQQPNKFFRLSYCKKNWSSRRCL